MYWSNVLTAVLPSSNASISLSGTGTTATVGAGPPFIGTFILNRISFTQVTKSFNTQHYSQERKFIYRNCFEHITFQGKGYEYGK